MDTVASSVVVVPAETGPSRGWMAARIALGLLLLALGIFTIRAFVSALAWAAVFAVALWPLYSRTVRRFGTGRHNLLWPALFTLAVALLFMTPLALVLVELAREARTGISWMRDVQEHGIAVPGVVARLPLIGSTVSEWWQQNLSDADGARRALGRLGRGNMVEVSRELGTQGARRIVTFFFVVITLFVLFRDGDVLVRQMHVASRRVFGPRGEELGRQIIASIHGTVDGLVLVGLGEGVVIGLAYFLAGVPHPVLFGAVTGIAAVMPFGAPVVFCLAALVLFANGSTVAALAVVVWGFVVAFLADHLIRPVLIGGATKLPFLWVLLGILGGVEVFGLLGLFLGPAIMAVLILLWRELADAKTAPAGS